MKRSWLLALLPRGDAELPWVYSRQLTAQHLISHALPADLPPYLLQSLRCLNNLRSENKKLRSQVKECN